MISDIVGFVNERWEQDQMVVLCKRLMGIWFKYTTQSGISLIKSDLKDMGIRNCYQEIFVC